jgi:phage terminase small subunit
MGRNAKPISILKQTGKKHLTKAEIKQREESEIKFGDNKLTCPEFVKNDIVAYAKWVEVTTLYKGADFVSSGDVGHLARYCKSFSEYQSLLECRSKIEAMDPFDTEESLMAKEVLKERFGTIAATKLCQKVEYILSVGGLIAIETAINKKMDMLIKMEDRLFLNPLAKVKNVPKKEPEKPADPLKKKGFGNV